ncbi:hypothetical protein [Embleya sp. NPDC005575]
MGPVVVLAAPDKFNAGEPPARDLLSDRAEQTHGADPEDAL